MLLNWYNIFFSVILGNTSRGVSVIISDFIIFVTFFYFLIIRLPYLYSVWFLSFFLVLFVFPIFNTLFLVRLTSSPTYFLSGFIPGGTPFFLLPFVCLIETLSYFVRPFVLILRPFMNLSIGVGFVYATGFLSAVYVWPVVLFFILFFYEIFISLVHWNIVCYLLSFSTDY